MSKFYLQRTFCKGNRLIITENIKCHLRRKDKGRGQGRSAVSSAGSSQIALLIVTLCVKRMTTQGECTQSGDRDKGKTKRMQALALVLAVITSAGELWKWQSQHPCPRSHDSPPTAHPGSWLSQGFPADLQKCRMTAWRTDLSFHNRSIEAYFSETVL